jgi:hypothetical protein
LLSVHYKIFVNGLTRSARMWFDLSENTIGRIPLSAFGPPRTVGAVLEPIMKLEEFSPSGYIFVPYGPSQPEPLQILTSVRRDLRSLFWHC